MGGFALPRYYGSLSAGQDSRLTRCDTDSPTLIAFAISGVAGMLRPSAGFCSHVPCGPPTAPSSRVDLPETRAIPWGDGPPYEALAHLPLQLGPQHETPAAMPRQRPCARRFSLRHVCRRFRPDLHRVRFLGQAMSGCSYIFRAQPARTVEGCSCCVHHYHHWVPEQRLR